MKKAVIILLLVCCFLLIGCKEKETETISKKPSPKIVPKAVKVVGGYGFYAIKIVMYPTLRGCEYVTGRVEMANNKEEAIEKSLEWYAKSEIYNPTFTFTIEGKLGQLFDSNNVNHLRFREKLLKEASAYSVGEK